MGLLFALLTQGDEVLGQRTWRGTATEIYILRADCTPGQILLD
jgi:hypothetical protein